MTIFIICTTATAFAFIGAYLEVKELAKQTAQATTVIQQQVEAMQESAALSVTAIEEITHIIEEINLTSQTVVSAVEEQSVTVNEIPRNVSTASVAAADVAKNVTESAAGLNEVNRNISEVDISASRTKDEINQVKESVEKISILAEKLSNVTRQFKV
jgi:methyl-accepting chemotaxis protein